MDADVSEYPYLEWLRLDVLVDNAENPNEMDEREFNGLVASIEQEDWVQPMASVVPLGDGTFEIVGGHHRKYAAVVMGRDRGPCWVLDPKKFDQDRRDWNLVKQNVLHGKLNPEKFSKMYDRLAKTYDAEVMQALMGFTNEDAFQKVYRNVRDSLPDDLKDALDSVKDEIKTIDDLSLVLNRLFAQFGETLPSNMMVFSWGGKEVLWIRCSEATWTYAKQLADEVAAEKGDMDAVLGAALEAHVLNV